MLTTLTIDDDVLAAAKGLAASVLSWKFLAKERVGFSFGSRSDEGATP